MSTRSTTHFLASDCTFNNTAISYCGRDGHSVEKIGNWSWLSLSWHRMDSGRYEIVAYLS